MRRIFYAILLMVVLLPLPRAAEGRTLVVYYSFTNDTRTIVGQLTDQMEADAEAKHWHGAAKDSWFQHLTYHTQMEEGASNEWLEAVTDEQYNRLP